jgi:uncharacterized protein YmfQ (DUF2313 family)
MVDVHTRRSGSDYRDGFLALLPRGLAWPKHVISSALWMACDGLAQYWGTVDARAADLLEQESDPRRTIELLPDWERNWGLPDPCFKNTTTLAERQAMLVFKMTLLGGQSRDFFITDVAKNLLGYTITITEYSPFMAGVSRAGDTRPMPPPPLDPNPLVGDFRWYIGPAELRYYWTVHVHAAKLVWFRASSGQAGVDHHLEIGLFDDLECLINRWKPAHTSVVFDYFNLVPGDPMAGTP